MVQRVLREWMCEGERKGKSRSVKAINGNKMKTIRRVGSLDSM